MRWLGVLAMAALVLAAPTLVPPAFEPGPGPFPADGTSEPSPGADASAAAQDAFAGRMPAWGGRFEADPKLPAPYTHSLAGAPVRVLFAPDHFLLDADGAPERIGIHPTPSGVRGDVPDGITNYLVGSDPTAWNAAVPRFQRLVYDLGDGLRLTFHLQRDALEFDLEVAAGADPSAFALTGLTLSEGMAAAGAWELSPPIVLQEGAPQASARFVTRTHGIGLEASGVDVSRPFVIDPAFTSIFGSPNDDVARGVTVTTTDVYLAGYTQMPFSGGGPGIMNPGDAWAVRLTNFGAVQYFTIFGGTSGDIPTGVALDAAGKLFVAGTTASTTFTAIGATSYDSVFDGGQDGFIVAFDNTGLAVAGSYVGGTASDEVRGVELDENGAPHMVGSTGSFTGIPWTYGAVGVNDGSDAMVIGLSANLATLRYAWALGGTLTDRGFGIVHLGLDRVGVVGFTDNGDAPPIKNGFRASPILNGDGYVAVMHIGAAGVLDPLYGTYVGGSALDQTVGITADPASPGAVFVVGSTNSPDLPITSGTLDPNADDGFAARIDWETAGPLSLRWMRGLGVQDTDRQVAITMDAGGFPVLAGSVSGAYYPVTSGAEQVTFGGTTDAVITILDPTDGALKYASYVGAGSFEFPDDIDIDDENCLTMVGFTGSASFGSPAMGVRGNTDAFAHSPAQCLPEIQPPLPMIEFTFSAVCAKQEMILADASVYTAPRSPVSYLWVLPDGSQQTGESITYVFEEAGYHLVTLWVLDNLGMDQPRHKYIYVCAAQEEDDGGPGGGGLPRDLPVDTDKDGQPDIGDNCSYVSNHDQADANVNGVGDACEAPPASSLELAFETPTRAPLPDADRDGVADPSDNCVSISNRLQDDFDDDGEGDACDSDIDGDLVPQIALRSAARLDNCPLSPNPEQSDSDLDLAGDACDPSPKGLAPVEGARQARSRYAPDTPAATRPDVGSEAALVLGAFGVGVLGLLLLTGAFLRRTRRGKGDA